MDFDYWLRAGVEHNIVFSPVRLAALRIHDEAKSIAKLAGFADELVTVYQRFFELPDLPDVIRSSSRKAMENIYYRASDCTFWANDLKKSRQYAKQAWSLNPFRIRRLWLYLLLGGYGRNLAEKTVGNPYLIRAQI